MSKLKEKEENKQKSRYKPVWIISLFIAVAIIGILLVLGGTEQKDTRVLAAEWIEKNIPKNAKIAVEGLGTPYAPFLKERLITDLDGYAPSNETFVINTTLRGSHTFYVYLGENEDLNLTITKQDLNWYDGSDELNILVYDSNDKLIENVTIPDDGTTNKTDELGPSQTLNIFVKSPGKGVYKIDLNAITRGADLLINQIETTQQKVVFSERIFPIDKGELFFKAFSNTTLDFITWHKTSLQNLTIDDNEAFYSVNINETQKHFLVNISGSDNLFGIHPPKSKIRWINEYKPSNKTFIINTTLRGSHAFYTYLGENEDLNFTITKQDLNWYDDSDELNILIYDSLNKLISNTTIPDDGTINKTDKLGPLQNRTLFIKSPGNGVYKIDLNAISYGGDLKINQIRTRQQKLVVFRRIFPLSNGTIYFKALSNDTLDFITYHNSSLQNITISNKDFHEIIEMNNVSEHFLVNISSSEETSAINSEKADYILTTRELYISFTPDSWFYPPQIKPPKMGDFILTSDPKLYFSFTPKSYFHPETTYPLERNMSWIKLRNINYVIITSALYEKYILAPKLYPKESEFYKDLEKEKLVKEFNPKAEGKGPLFKIYEVES